MSLLDELSDKALWMEYREHKVKGNHITKRELKLLDEFINEERYLKITAHIFDENIPFDYPHKKVINKSGTKKKRVVYTYSLDEMFVLKLMMYLLSRYDDKLSSSCYSFRRTKSVKGAIGKIVRSKYARNSYVYKADIHNYFNSMDVDILIHDLGLIIDDDPELLKFISKLLSVNKAYDGNSDKVIEEKRGGMAGTPISPFFANVYLKSLDDLFSQDFYFRYSDDILIFAKEKDELDRKIEIFKQHILDKKLELNPDKITLFNPGEPWEFLGFKYIDGKIDLSDVTLNKIKSKIKRKANKLYRWRIKKDRDFDSAAKALIKTFNRKFYGKQQNSDIEDEVKEFTWSRWFFPVLDTSDSLAVIDDYLVQYIRYLYSGRHYKGNYKITYEYVKNLGFRSLVNEYYKEQKEENRT